MAYKDTRPVIVVWHYSGGRVSRVVMTAKEAGERITDALVSDSGLAHVEVIPVDGVSGGYLESQR